MARPRNKRERNIVAMSSKLPKLTAKHIEWAKKTMFKDTGYFMYRKREIWCQCCGAVEPFPLEMSPAHLVDVFKMDGYICPCCGHSLEVSQYNKKGEHTPTHVGMTEGSIFCIITTYKGWQVVRGVEAYRHNEAPGKQTDYGVNEIFQIWMDADGKETIASKRYGRNIMGGAYWNPDSEWGISHHNENPYGNYYLSDIFDVRGMEIYPIVRVMPKLRQHGWNAKVKRAIIGKNVNIVDVFGRLLTHDKSEWLAKTGQYDMLACLCVRGDYNVGYEHAVKVCIRNHYIIKDASMWLDYMDALAYLGKDTHNAHYVCPQSLKKAHDEYVGMMERKQAKEEERRKREEAIKQIERDKEAAKEYKAERSEFIGMEFGDDEIQCHVLKDVHEFAEEGMAMHHCVFQQKYYDMKKHGDALILSARNNIGGRVETVEVNLKTFSIVQSRGRFNQSTPLHPHIIKLVQDYMPMIRKTAQKQNLAKIRHENERAATRV